MTMSARRLFARRPRLVVLVAVVTVAFTLQLLGANPAVSQSQALVAYRTTESPGLDPAASIWDKVPAVEMALTSRQVQLPLGEPTGVLDARAVHSGGVLFIRMSWDDDTPDTQAVGVDRFTDAAAIEFPARAASSVPALCMGQTDGGMNIWHWRAANQEGLPDSIEDLSATGYVDRYPSTDDLYFPARATGNPVSLSHPVQDLVAVGFGTLSPAADQAVRGSAVWDDGQWSVVFARELSHDAAEQVDLGEGASADVAFAVWDGSQGERDGIKSVSAFVVLDVAAEGIPRTTAAWLAIVFGSLLGVGVLALILGTAMDRAVNRRTDAASRSAAARPT
jgi:hypothetical protein